MRVMLYCTHLRLVIPRAQGNSIAAISTYFAVLKLGGMTMKRIFIMTFVLVVCVISTCFASQVYTLDVQGKYGTVTMDSDTVWLKDSPFRGDYDAYAEFELLDRDADGNYEDIVYWVGIVSPHKTLIKHIDRGNANGIMSSRDNEVELYNFKDDFAGDDRARAAFEVITENKLLAGRG